MNGIEHITGEHPAIGQGTSMKLGLVLILVASLLGLTAAAAVTKYRVDQNEKALAKQDEKGGQKDVEQDKDTAALKTDITYIKRTTRKMAKKLGVDDE